MGTKIDPKFLRHKRVKRRRPHPKRRHLFFNGCTAFMLAAFASQSAPGFAVVLLIVACSMIYYSLTGRW